MAGTVEGGKKAAKANLANNPNFYREIGLLVERKAPKVVFTQTVN